MGFLKNIFGKKEETIKSYADFWDWFLKHKQTFHEVVKQRHDVEVNFLNKLTPMLDQLKDGYLCLAGMCDADTAELVLTADGDTRNIVFVEELVSCAPAIRGWKFTALKPSLGIDQVGIEMGGYKFNKDNISFYSNEFEAYPDEIDITVVHNDLNEENKVRIINGVYIFLDNYLGELEFTNNIDNLTIIGKDEAQKELVPISKLRDFLNWRRKEFIEKYEGARYDTEHDNYAVYEAELESGRGLIAVINSELLNWDSKASHPWICTLTIKYDGSEHNGMPAPNDYELLGQIEEEMMVELKDSDGYLNVGRQTVNGEREIYFACKDFRKPSKVFYQVQQKYKNRFEMDYSIYKDKYWQSFERFANTQE